MSSQDNSRRSPFLNRKALSSVDFHASSVSGDCPKAGVLAAFSIAAQYKPAVELVVSRTRSRLPHPWRMMVVSLPGVLVSVVAGYVALLYRGYSNRNWARADEVARKHNWLDLLPEGSSEMMPEHGGKPGRVTDVAWRLARPCYPQTDLAPVFTIFSSLALCRRYTRWLFRVVVSRLVLEMTQAV